jgi:outer membrane protein assembly factor BamD (BamD/ComL family)
MRTSLTALLVWSVTLAAPATIRAEFLDLERYKELREVERYHDDVAEKEFKNGKMPAAIEAFGKFVKLFPNSPAASFAQYMLGVCHEQKMDVRTAIKRIQIAIIHKCC